MISAFIKAYWKQLLIALMLAAIVFGCRIAWVKHGQAQYDAGYAKRGEEQVAADKLTRKQREEENARNEREAQSRIDQARNDAMLAAQRAGALAGCSTSSIPSGSGSESIPPLTALGRQPETPEYCLPTCSANLSNEIDSWQTSLTGQLPPEPPASGSTTP